MKKIILFDMDGTLIDSMPIWEQAPLMVLNSLGIEPEEDVAEIFRKVGYSETARYLVKKYDLKHDPHYFMSLMDKAVVPAYEKTVMLKPGALDYLRKLKKRKVDCLILSANDPFLVNIIKERFGLDKYIKSFISSKNIGSTKAEAESFVKIAMLFGVEPSDMILFEDSLYAIKTASEVGVTTVCIEDNTSLTQKADIQKYCTRYVRDFRELLVDDIL